MTVEEKNQIINSLSDELQKLYNAGRFDELVSKLNNLKDGSNVVKDGEKLVDNLPQLYENILSILIVDTLKNVGASINYDYELPKNLVEIFKLLGFNNQRNVFITFFKVFFINNGSDAYTKFNDTNLSVLFNLWRNDDILDADLATKNNDKLPIFFNEKWFDLQSSGDLRTITAKLFKSLYHETSDTALKEMIYNLRRVKDIPSELSSYLRNRNGAINKYVFVSLILTNMQEMSDKNATIRDAKVINNILEKAKKSVEVNRNFSTDTQKKNDISDKFKSLSDDKQSELIKSLFNSMSERQRRDLIQSLVNLDR